MRHHSSADLGLERLRALRRRGLPLREAPREVVARGRDLTTLGCRSGIQLLNWKMKGQLLAEVLQNHVAKFDRHIRHRRCEGR